jgi:hypothetical protein
MNRLAHWRRTIGGRHAASPLQTGAIPSHGINFVGGALAPPGADWNRKKTNKKGTVPCAA